mmetsp:Transcript_3079/g.4683  ORF Transcript_3079/g.4683 Transcript_3079/m.4683 type:complete len:434 (-) Transcript_3079:40-1341(-)
MIRSLRVNKRYATSRLTVRNVETGKFSQHQWEEMAPDKLAALRKERRAKMNQNHNQTGKEIESKQTYISKKSLLWGSLIGSLGIASLVYYTNDEKLGKYYHGSFIQNSIRWCQAQWYEIVKSYTEPSREKLLPDWPPFFIPADFPQMPTLVLDLEDTLIHMDWSRKNGWRVAKRPGVNKFLEELGRYYEIVIFTHLHQSLTEPIIHSLDSKRSSMFQLYRNDTRYINGYHVKDLSKLNRDLSRVIVIDDDPKAFQLNPNNAILVKKYKLGPGIDPNDDTVLLDLIPFLKAIVQEDVKDVRPILSSFKGKYSSEIVENYKTKVNYAKEKEKERQHEGLGGLLRHSKKASLNNFNENSERVIPNSAELLDSFEIDSSVGVHKSFEGVPPPPPEKQGSVVKWYRSFVQEKMEEKQRKLEKLHEKMLKEKDDQSAAH